MRCKDAEARHFSTSHRPVHPLRQCSVTLGEGRRSTVESGLGTTRDRSRGSKHPPSPRDSPRAKGRHDGVSDRCDIDFEEHHRRACASVIHQLSDWFGVEASNQAYVAALGRLPTFLVEDGKSVIGFIALEETSVEAVEIHVLAVVPNRHRAGIGRALVSHAEDWVRSRRSSILHVKTLGPSHPDPFYARTRSFYQALGFRTVFETTAFCGPRNPTLVLVKFV
jgi:GNAT superfamily N-acetyltransferase